MQLQSRNVSQIKEETLSNQKEGPQAPLTKQTTERHIEQRPETHIMPEHTIRPKMTETQIPIYPDPLVKPPPRLWDIEMQHDRKINLDFEINKDFKENSLYQEGTISELYQRTDKSHLLEPQELEGLQRSVKRYTSLCNNKGDTTRISK